MLKYSATAMMAVSSSGQTGDDEPSNRNSRRNHEVMADLQFLIEDIAGEQGSREDRHSQMEVNSLHIAARKPPTVAHAIA